MSARGGTDLEQTDEEELLLIVSGMGTVVQAQGDEPAGYMVGDECKECVGDLQRYLRRDDQMVMAAHRALYGSLSPCAGTCPGIRALSSRTAADNSSEIP